MLLFALAVFASTTKVSVPNYKITPGHADPAVTASDVCKPGFAKSRRHVTIEQKKQVFAAYEIPWEQHSKFEVDHLISLELGGVNSNDNLWPQPYDPRPGAHEKDFVEDDLHRRVCKGEISLQRAQYIVSHLWLEYYKTHHASKK